MKQAEYCDPEPSDAPVASLRIPGDTRVLLLALVLTILGLPIIAADTFGSGGGSESIVVEAAAATSETTSSSTPASAPPKVIQVLSDGDERIDEAYQKTRAAQRAADDEVTATTEADEAPSTTEASTPEPTAPPTTKPPAPRPAPAPAAPVGDVWGRLAQCESGGNWAHQGSYHGGLQFHPSTWTAYGGTQYAQYAYQATPSQQIAVAERVVAAAGGSYRGWPGCRARLGLP
jgi:hypothetical protein